MNGMNGGNVPAGVVGFAGPIPAGHQAELNYIYGMVEELSRQLADNRRVTDDIVVGLGRVRNRAQRQGLRNDELIGEVAEDLGEQERNLEALISLLSDSLEKAKYSRDANMALLTQYATVTATMLKQFHEYKLKHVTDVAAWHRSYRAQLAEARAENSRLREQIWEMQAHAGNANALLRDFRQKYDEDAARWERTVDAKAARQELRFWKRMAMPELPEDDAYWSDDDDIVFDREKERLRELEKRALEMQMAAEGSQAGSEDDDAEGEDGEAGERMGELVQVHVGGVAMEREGSAAVPGAGQLPMGVPPRPSSQASSTGSSGQ